MRSITLLSLFSFLLCYHCIFFTFKTSLASAKCLEDQQSLLLQLKNNLTFNPEISTKLKFWNKSIDCCIWSGVTCDQEGLVIGLDLSEEDIYGGFDNSSSLFTLGHLQKLNLAYNSFNSLIPSGWSKLEKLTYLNLSEAGFKGQVPIEISQLTRLVTLDISFPFYHFDFYHLFNQFSSSTPPPKLKIPNLQKLIQNLTNMRQLYLDGISITSRGHEWSNALLPLRDLQELSMYSCSLSGPLDSSLSKLENLSVIILGENNFSSPVPETFANFKNLITLNLPNCGLTGTFPQNIFQIRTLSVIDLSDNPNLHVFFPDYSLSEHLHSISVSNTSLSGAFPHTIGNMTNLILLDLSYCQLYGTLPNSMSNLTHLTLLYLDHNDLSGAIPSYLFTLPSLKRISLTSNHFNKFDEFINASFSVLKYLYLYNNNISGNFPTPIFQLHSLSFLDLSYNRLNGSLQLDELLKLRNLTALDLSYNNLFVDVNDANAGQIAFPNFIFLFLASCNLQAFPRFLMNQSTLKYLDLSDNQIQGKMPIWIWKLQDLTHLNISHNFLTDIKGSLQNLTSNLRVLDLHNNKLLGSVPLFPMSVEYLDFSTNNITVIPHDIGNYLSSVYFLSLSNNNLQGSIPVSLCNASKLEVLDISFNNISGTISPCLINMTGTLKALNLRKNNLTGPIPDSFPTSCVVSSLNFNGNLLHGPIPNSLSHCSSLKVLNIGSNQISGGFPCFLKNISTLCVLVLRNNKFHGSIECSHSLENKPWKMIQIVDIAFNNFSGKLPKKYFTTWERMMNDENGVVSDFIHIGDRGSPYSYYQDSVTVSYKGLQMEFVKILTIFTVIDFSSNNFEGPIPEVLMDFKELHGLNFSNNGLSGEIPSTIGNLKQLESLDLSNNSLVGEIPVQLASLSFLSYLDLSNNNLEGRIQDSFCNAYLQVLDLSFNNISGTISPCIITMTSTLEALNLRKNNLSGPIPDMFPTSCSLESLKFHENILHGPIPKSLSHCSSLKLLDIGSNQIVDRFPCFLKNIPTLTVLVLRNNHFHGSIKCSHSLENKPWKMIQIVDISFNNFNGKLPENYFTTWERMIHDEDAVSRNKYTPQQDNSYYQDSVTVTCKGHQMELVKIQRIYTVIDFSYNYFEGPIPKVLMDFKALYVLNFSNNTLSGEIPSTIWNLKQLESLDLSNNSLIGEIPTELTSLTFLSYLNLSFNHLVGRIPTGTQLQSFEASSFEGNDGLYGPPLNVTQDGKRPDLHSQQGCGRLACSIDWNILSVELGFVSGLAIIIGPIMFWKQWRIRYWKLVDKTLCWIFSRMFLEYVTDRGQTYTVLRW